jgi:uncharacterized protein (DUF1697 family)
MNTYVALLRAVNVGGTGKLPMADLREMCEGIGFINVRTYIASGNVVFASALSAGEVKAALEDALAVYAEKPVGVVVLSPDEIATALAENPFADRASNHTVAIFLDGAPPPSTIDRVTGRQNEDIALGQRVIYVSYGDGMADSKLKIPAAAKGTARNMNTVAALVRLSG